MRNVFTHDPASKIVAGTIGEPGSRQFFLQISSTRLVTTISIEKEQLIALVERIEELIKELRRRKLIDIVGGASQATNFDLDFPLEEDFRASNAAQSPA